MQYDVEVVAEELMLTADDLKEIFEYYFEDAVELIASCYKANSELDYITLTKKIHALKGSSMNLRMHEIAVMVIKLQSSANKEDGAEITLHLSKIENKLVLLKEEICVFYNNLYEKRRGSNAFF